MASKSQNAPPSALTKNLELSDDLKKLGFSKVAVPVNGITKKMIIVHNDGSIIATLDIHNWSNTDKSVRAAFSHVGIDNQMIEKFMVFLSQKYVKLMEEALADSSRKEEKEIKDKKVYYMQKYSNGLLAEAVLIAGQPYFLVSENAEISIVPSIDLEDRVIKPLEQDSYLSGSYTFTSEQELKNCIQKAKKESLDSLFRRVKSIYRKYVDADDFHISICAADIVYTYYQDKIGLTHYLFFVGNNDSGKSNNLRVVHMLSYRNFMSTDVTAPNIFQFLGNHEEGEGTLCIDEADTIDAIHELMSIFKNGYTKGFPVSRVYTSINI